MPDLNQIKQGEQGGAGQARAVREGAVGAARGRVRGADPQSGRACSRRRPDRDALCLERILPPCREARVKFALPPIESAGDIAAAMKAVTSALASGAITPGEAERIAAVVDTFVRAIDASDFDRRLQELEDASEARADARIAESGPPWIYNR